MKDNTSSASVTPSRILYPMIRVSNIERSLMFYTNALGMRELRRESFKVGRFTLLFVGYGEEENSTVLELTYNWDEHCYEHGTGYGHLALEVTNIYAACTRLARMGVKVVRGAGPMAFAADGSDVRETIAFVEDPDGYRIELIERR